MSAVKRPQPLVGMDDEAVYLDASPLRAAWMVAANRQRPLGFGPRLAVDAVRAFAKSPPRVRVRLNGVTFLMSPPEAMRQADRLAAELVPAGRPFTPVEPLATLLRLAAADAVSRAAA